MLGRVLRVSFFELWGSRETILSLKGLECLIRSSPLTVQPSKLSHPSIAIGTHIRVQDSNTPNSFITHTKQVPLQLSTRLKPMKASDPFNIARHSECLLHKFFFEQLYFMKFLIINVKGQNQSMAILLHVPHSLEFASILLHVPHNLHLHVPLSVHVPLKT